MTTTFASDLDRLVDKGNLVRFWDRDYGLLWTSGDDDRTPSTFVTDHIIANADAVLNATVDFPNDGGVRWSGRMSGHEMVRADSFLRVMEWPTNPILDGTEQQ